MSGTLDGSTSTSTNDAIQTFGRHLLETFITAVDNSVQDGIINLEEDGTVSLAEDNTVGLSESERLQEVGFSFSPLPAGRPNTKLCSICYDIYIEKDYCDQCKASISTISEECSQDCSVCLSDITLGETVYRSNCKHLFHLDCIIPWFKRKHKTCPSCRGIMYKQEETRIARHDMDPLNIFLREYEQILYRNHNNYISNIMPFMSAVHSREENEEEADFPVEMFEE